MAVTQVTDVANQQLKFWSSKLEARLRDSLLLGNFVDRSYEGDLKAAGDTVYVSQLVNPTGQNLTVGVDDDSFSSEAASTSRVSIQANKVAVAALQFTDLAEAQSQINKDLPAVRDALAYAVGKQINDYLYTLLSPSTSSPDHLLNSVSVIDRNELAFIRGLAGAAQWDTLKPWVSLVSPGYWAGILAQTDLTSGDYAGDIQTVAGADTMRRFGFNMYEDNSRSGKLAVFFHPDFMHLVRGQVEVKVSDLHSNHQFGALISARVVYGAVLGNQGANKHIKVLDT